MRIIFYFILIISVAFYYLSQDMILSKENLALPLIFLLGLLILFVLTKESHGKLKQNAFKHSNLALLGILIVSFQVPLDYFFGNIGKNNSFLFVNNNIVVKSMWLSICALATFIIGYRAYRYPQIKLSYKAPLSTRYLSTLFLRLGFILSIIIYFATVNPLYLAGYYGSEKMGTSATYAALLIKLFGYAYIILKTRQLYIHEREEIRNLFSFIKKMRIEFNLFLIFYLISVMISGDRGPLISFTLAYISGYFIITKFKLSYKKGLIFLVIGAVFITSLGVVRSMNKELSFIDRFKSSIQENTGQKDDSFSPHTFELASSIKAIHHAVDHVPQKHEFLYGRFQFQQILFAIPFGDSFRRIIYENNSYQYNGSASFITWIFQGDFPSYGNGTSVITDFYLDFGLLGVMVGMFIFGYLIRLAEVNMYNDELPSLFIHIFIVTYLASSLYISRSSLLFELRTIVWIFLLLLINKYFFNRKHA